MIYAVNAVLDVNGLRRGQERTSKEKTPQNTVNLQTSTVKADAEDPKDRDLKYCFRVVSRDRMYLLQARSILATPAHRMQGLRWGPGVHGVGSAREGTASSSPGRSVPDQKAMRGRHSDGCSSA